MLLCLVFSLPEILSQLGYLKALCLVYFSLFPLFQNDTLHEIGSSIRLFADDTSLYVIGEDPNVAAELLSVAAELLNADLEKIAELALKWLVKFNPLKT